MKERMLITPWHSTIHDCICYILQTLVNSLTYTREKQLQLGQALLHCMPQQEMHHLVVIVAC